MTRFSGRCHCGAIGFEYECAHPPEAWPIRACQCRFCRCHDALSTSLPDARLSFQAQNAEKLQRYRFGLNTADFLLCRECGVYLGAVIETPNGRYGIINTHALDPMPENIAASVPAHYDGEDTDARISRREQRWTAVSTIPW